MAYNQNMMKRLHITAAGSISVEELLQKNLPLGWDASALLACGAVWLGPKRCQAGQLLVKGDTLMVYGRQQQHTHCQLTADEIVFHDENLLVVYKHSGLPVQGDPASQYNHLSHGVWQHLGAPADWRPAPITRLDQPVSGLVLFGAQAQSEKDLFALMRERKIHKWYRAILAGVHGDSCRMVTLPLAHHGRFIRVDEAGKEAVTFFVPQGAGLDWREFSVFPLTGRRHQIRVHAASALGPIVGDTLYGGPKLDEPGIALCCIGLNLSLNGLRYRIRLRRKGDF